MVSVVITCYNYDRFLDQCIQSALGQTYQSLEVVIVDDGSTDNTREVVEKFLHLPNVKYIYQENSGQTKAKNVGVANSTGKFIAFLDADDFWDLKKLEKQIPKFSNPKVGVVYSGFSLVDQNGWPVVKTPAGQYMQPRRGPVVEELFMDNFVPFSSSVVTKDCFMSVGGFDESLAMGIDWDLWLRISVDYNFDYIHEPLLFYRIGHSDQMSKNTEVRQHCSDRIMKKFIQNYPGVLSKKLIRNAFAYTYCNRGFYYRNVDFKSSYLNYFKAFCQKPWDPIVFRGILGTLVKQISNN